jgi:FKBP-type peptidyl-prolyl cis-trans isomerase FklB
MYNAVKPVFASLACVTLLSFNAFAQTPPKPAPKAVPVKAKPVAAKPAAVPGVVMAKEIDSVAYAIGLSIGGSLEAQGLASINTDLLLKGIKANLTKTGAKLTQDQASQVLQTYFGRKQAEMQKEAEAASEPNRIAGEKFLEENKKKSTVKTTESGLQYEVIKLGDGPKPKAEDRVKTHYHGTLIDGTVFDSSVERGEPVEFPVGGVIQGWQEALQLMPVGSKFKLYLPYQLAYGENPAGPKIGPKSALVFEVELLEILK